MKPIWSKKDITNSDDSSIKEFFECIKDIFTNKKFKTLNNFYQHCNTSRLQHCLNVSYYSYLTAKKLKLDYKSAARAALLHDFFLYDRHKSKLPENHIFYHPKEALNNALEIVDLNEIEKDAILKHMWPLCKGAPSSKEGFVLTWVDKYCAISEVSVQIYKMIKNKLYLKPTVSKKSS